NGVNPVLFDANRFSEKDVLETRRKLGVEQSPVLMFVGSLRPWHGVRYLLRAYRYIRKENKEVNLVIVGDGPERKLLDELSGELREAVVWLPNVSYWSLPSVLSVADIAVAPFHGRLAEYYCPIKLFEYMAMSKPILAGVNRFTEKLIGETGSGETLDVSDPDMFADRISGLLEDQTRRKKLGLNGRKAVTDRYSWDHNVERMIKIYGKVRED
ncbi:MAG: glycosyltransferase family 4 protein, partial [Candidatus Ranarchaeia archaeon]